MLLPNSPIDCTTRIPASAESSKGEVSASAYSNTSPTSSAAASSAVCPATSMQTTPPICPGEVRFHVLLKAVFSPTNVILSRAFTDVLACGRGKV